MKQMVKSARIIFIIIGSVFPILIGALHTFTHFNELTSDKVQHLLAESIPINGQEQTLWNTWGIMSFMMGLAFIVIGLLNFTTYRRLGKNEMPPIPTLLAMVIYLLGVIYVGHQFEQAPQFYGGVFGLILTSICMFLCLKGTNIKKQNI